MGILSVRFRMCYLLLVIAIAAIAFACSQNTPDAMISSKSSLENCRIVKHEMGETCIPLKPQRLIVTDAAILDAVVALGFQPTATAESNAMGSLTRHLVRANKLKEPISIGLESLLNFEKIVQLQPDLILGFSIYSQDYKILSRIAPTVSLPYSHRTWKDSFQKVGTILGKSEEAKQILLQYQKRVTTLRSQIEQKLKKTVVSVSRFYSGWQTTEFQTKFSFSGSVLEDVGLTRPAVQLQLANPNQQYVEVSLEQLDLLDADVMFVALDPGSEESLKRYQTSKLWQLLDVVKNNRVYTVDSAYWISGNVLSANAILDDLYRYLLDGE
ncbi:MAG: iron-siderophore ABC transporter substrate-binding protein [Scytonema sp. CRU_2_7]|nr:iron-siderophore ABC transporter substrate-binding protein [Scytonema sp. CRU_2_7]